MGCNCGGKSAKSDYLITYKDGTTETVSDIASARIKVAKKGGTYRAVARVS